MHASVRNKDAALEAHARKFPSGGIARRKQARSGHFALLITYFAGREKLSRMHFPIDKTLPLNSETCEKWTSSRKKKGRRREKGTIGSGAKSSRRHDAREIDSMLHGE